MPSDRLGDGRAQEVKPVENAEEDNVRRNRNQRHGRRLRSSLAEGGRGRQSDNNGGIAGGSTQRNSRPPRRSCEVQLISDGGRPNDGEQHSQTLVSEFKLLDRGDGFAVVSKFDDGRTEKRNWLDDEAIELAEEILRTAEVDISGLDL